MEDAREHLRKKLEACFQFREETKRRLRMLPVIDQIEEKTRADLQAVEFMMDGGYISTTGEEFAERARRDADMWGNALLSPTTPQAFTTASTMSTMTGEYVYVEVGRIDDQAMGARIGSPDPSRHRGLRRLSFRRGVWLSGSPQRGSRGRQ